MYLVHNMRPYMTYLPAVDKMAGEVMAEGMKLDVLDVCPLLILQDSSKRFYDGYITVCVSSNVGSSERVVHGINCMTSLIITFCRRRVSECLSKFRITDH